MRTVCRCEKADSAKGCIGSGSMIRLEFGWRVASIRCVVNGFDPGGSGVDVRIGDVGGVGEYTKAGSRLNTLVLPIFSIVFQVVRI